MSKSWKKAKNAKKVKIEEKPIKYKHSGRRFDSIEVNRYENTDFEDISDEKLIKHTIESAEEKSIEASRPKSLSLTSIEQPTTTNPTTPAKRRNGYNYNGQKLQPTPEPETTVKSRTSRRKPTTTTSLPQVSSEEREVTQAPRLAKPEKIQLPPLRSINKYDTRKTSTFYYTPTVPTVPKTSTTEKIHRLQVLTTLRPTTFVPRISDADNQKTEKHKRNKGKKIEIEKHASSENSDSSTPAHGQDSLASLATYFADSENKTHEQQPRNVTSTLSVKTTKKYAELFGFNKNEETKANLKESNITYIQPTKKAINETANILTNIVKKPESRKIAEVFSNALTTYLKDPSEFRKTLSNVRPTEPTLSLVTTTLGNSAESVTEYESFEINKNRVKYSTVAPKKAKLIEDSEEILQRAHSQNFVNNNNNIKSSNKKSEPHFVQKSTTTTTASTTTTTTTTPKPTTTTTTLRTTTESQKIESIEQMAYLDPITINDQLMNEIKTTTSSSFTYLPKRGSKKTHHIDSGEFLNTPFITPTAPLVPFVSSEENSNESHSARYLTAELPSSSGMQKIANKIFGGLNDTEAGHLMNVMKKAKDNKSALHLILLLIQTCDDENGRAIEKSRRAILKSLIQLDHRNDLEVQTTPHPFAITTFRRDYTPVRTTLASIIESTTTATPPESTKFEIRVDDTTTENLQSDATTNLIRKTKDVEGQSEEVSSSASNNHKSSDKRALELLKSLYFLASKYDSRR